MTSKEAARFLKGVREDTIRQWVHRGLLPVAGRLGRANLFSASDLRAARDAARQRNTSSTPTTRPHRELSRASFDTLVTINPASAATSTVGSFGFPHPTGGRDGMDADPATGTLWGLGDAEARTYTINALTGAATVIAQQVCWEGGIANTNCSGGGFNGLAISPVPEPGSALLLAGGLALLQLGRRR